MAHISSFTVSERAVVFRFGTAECRLTFADSVHCGWRLQTGGEPFAETGASQSLALFMGEPAPEKAFPLTVENNGECCRITAECGAQALLGPDSITFLTGGGAAAAVLTDLTEADGKTIISGLLEKDEAVYGCGERFNRLNMRGTSFDMFTCDGWNNSSTTYVAIPLFSTSRGAGVFVNRYERMLFDFGERKTDTWSVSIQHRCADMYVFASGKIIDAIAGYMDLSGHPTEVRDWFAGPQLCRYTPDYRLLKGATETARPRWSKPYTMENGEMVNAGICFTGDGVVDIVKRFCAMDAKPRAVIFEGWSSESAFKPDDPSETVVIADRGPGGELRFADEEKTDLLTVTVPAMNANRKQALRDCADYLHSLGIKLMMYAPAGGCCIRLQNIPGWKEEYLLHISMSSDDPAYNHESFIGAPWMVCADTANVDVAGGKGGASANEKGVMLDLTRRFDYLDITNDEAWDWYINTIWKELTDLGVDGVKIDFCEVLPDSGSRYFIRGTKSAAEIELLWKHPEKLYGTVGCEHHAYASFFISKFLRDVSPFRKDGFMLLSRGGGIGSQRNPYMWAGDQTRSIGKLDDQLFAVLNSGLSGLPYLTYDCGGYHYAKPDGIPVRTRKNEDGNVYLYVDYSPSTQDECFRVEDETAIFLRAIEFTVFSANVQTHGDVRHAYEMTEEGQRLYTLYMKLHALLQDYINHFTSVTAATGMPVSRHMVLEFPEDAVCRSLENQYMFGSTLLVAPVFEKEAGSRRVYLPEGSWKDLRSGSIITGGTYTEAAYGTEAVPVFMRMNDTDTQASALAQNTFESEIWKRIIS